MLLAADFDPSEKKNLPSLISEADVVLADPTRVVAALIALMSEHDVTFETEGARTLVDLGVGTGMLEVTGTMLKLRVEAADQGALEALRSVVAEHVVAFAAEESPRISWRGHVTTEAAFANFREVRLERAIDITPRMRRLTFTGDVGLFASDSDLHVRMYFPPEGVDRPQWPRPGPDGRIVWPPEELRPAVRYYTVRRVDPTAGEIDIDFVLHDDTGPGATFAAAAREGAICGMAGPFGRAARPARFMLFAGDETAIPAIARMLESIPSTARGEALIEIGDIGEEPPLVVPAGVTLRWLHREGARPGTTSLLIDALRAAAWPEDQDVFVWVACESCTAKTIRRYLRQERKLDQECHLVTGYWERDRAAEGNDAGEP